MPDFSTLDDISSGVNSLLKTLVETIPPSPDCRRRARELAGCDRQHLIVRAQVFAAKLVFCSNQETNILTDSGRQAIVDEWVALRSCGQMLDDLMRSSNKDVH